MEQLSKLEIIEETVAYYSEDVNRRAESAGHGCFYHTEDGRMCAVGRCLINPVEVEAFVQAKLGGLASVFELNSKTEGIDTLLKEEYKGHSLKFWEDLQNLHDASFDSFWDKDGITKLGLRYVKQLKEDYSDTE